MGYEGHLMVLDDRARSAAGGRGGDGAAAARRTPTSAATSSRRAAPAPTTSTPTTGVTEIQAGSYALMDTSYATLGLPFEQALFVSAR